MANFQLALGEEDEYTVSVKKVMPATTAVIFYKYIRPCVAEFLGTILFVFVCVCGTGHGETFPGLSTSYILVGIIAMLATVRYRLSARLHCGVVFTIRMLQTNADSADNFVNRSNSFTRIAFLFHGINLSH